MFLFRTGHFVFSKTGNPFSALPFDQAHEQNNDLIKNNGGVSGLTHDPASLRRIMLAGPEVTRLLSEFKGVPTSARKGGKHHEQHLWYQNTFKSHCSALKNSFLQYQNPFNELGPELITLDTRASAGSDATKILLSLEELGKEKVRDFLEKRLKTRTTSLYQTIPKNNVKIFGNKRKPLHPSKQHEKLQNLKADSLLYWRLYVSSVARQLDLSKFFQHENQTFPPALTSNGGQMRSGNKADLVKILEKLVPPTQPGPGKCAGVIIDGAFLVHNIAPRAGVETFSDYVDKQILPHAQHLATGVSATRVDFVWDLYSEKSTKSRERESRGSGIRKRELPQKDKNMC